MTYKLYTSLERTLDLDGQVDLSLHVELDSAPIWLSDFAGGSGELYNGYTTTGRKFKIISAHDKRRIVLVFNEGDRATLSPEFVRHFNPHDPLNQLQAIPLKSRQTLLLAYENEALASEYIVTGSNWRLA